MRSDGNAIRGLEVLTPHLDIEAIREWVRSRLTAERIAEAGLVAATVVLAGYLGAVLYRGVQTYSMTSF